MIMLSEQRQLCSKCIQYHTQCSSALKPMNLSYSQYCQFRSSFTSLVEMQKQLRNSRATRSKPSPRSVLGLPDNSMTTKNPVSKVVRSRLEKTMSLIECPCMANYEIRNETSCRRCHKYASRYQRAIDRKETCSRKLAEDYVSTVSRKQAKNSETKMPGDSNVLKDILPERTHLMEKLFLEPEFAEVKMSKVCVEAQKESKYDSLHDNRCCGIPCVVDAFETIVPVKRSFRKHFMELLQKP